MLLDIEAAAWLLLFAPVLDELFPLFAGVLPLPLSFLPEVVLPPEVDPVVADPVDPPPLVDE